jgi:hypothetical protein
MLTSGSAEAVIGGYIIAWKKPKEALIADGENSRSLGFLLTTNRRVECCGIPLKPKEGLNGAPSLRCR